MQPAQSIATKTSKNRWSTRLGSLHAVVTWRRSVGTEHAPILAFNLIAGDRGILNRARRADAVAMAASAESLIAQAESGAESGRAFPDIAWGRAAIVRDRIAAWRGHDDGSAAARVLSASREPAAPDSFDPDGFDPDGGPDCGEVTELTMTENLKRDFPLVRPSSARHVFEITRRLGCAGLTRLGAPMDAVFALGAARVAAQASLGKLCPAAFPEHERLRVIGIAQDWGEQTGGSPFATNGHGGRVGSVTQRVIDRAVETSACVDMAAQLPNGVSASGFAQWEDALETHGYVLMSAPDPRLEELPYHRARDIGSAAARLAARVIADPRRAPPELPPGWAGDPRDILGSVISMLAGDIAPRRSPRPNVAPSRVARVAGPGRLAPPFIDFPAAPKTMWMGVESRR